MQKITPFLWFDGQAEDAARGGGGNFLLDSDYRYG